MEKHENNNRIFLASIIGLVLWTTIYCFLPKIILANIGYSFGLLALLMLAGTIYLVSSGSKARYITNAAFPLVAARYAGLNLVFTAVVVFLAMALGLAMPWKLFVVLHLVFISWFLWKILAMDAGQEAIANTEEKIRERLVNWRAIKAETDVIVSCAPAEFGKVLRQMQETIRYADPMGDSRVQELAEKIYEQLAVLKKAVDKKDADAITQGCEQIKDTVKQRGIHLKAMK